MPIHWAIDLGTSNTTVCEDRSGRPHVVKLDDLMKLLPVTQTPVIASAICVLDPDAREVLIGQPAITYNWDGSAAGFARGFKRHLGVESTRTMARVGHRSFSARDATALFLRELVAAIEARFDTEVTDLTIATPSASFETYRAELQAIVRDIKRPPWWRRLWGRMSGRGAGLVLRTLDEPVAAALGYGVDVARDQILVAFDFGAGTMEAAVVQTLAGKTVETGRARVLAKQGVRLGGDDVDQWIVDALVTDSAREWPEHRQGLLWEAERVKLLASAGHAGTFTFKNRSYGTLDHAGLSELLARHGVFDQIRTLVRRLLAELSERHGLAARDLDEVILEGGSTLLPEVRNVLADLFGRDQVREWLPFEAVARGACVYASGGPVEDFIYHDYALRVMRDEGDASEYELLIPSGTVYPTADDFATRYYAPGFVGQKAISLFVCEVGRSAGRSVDWEERQNGSRYYVPRTEGERAFCLCLNEADPALSLDPPGKGDAPRLRVTYSVNADRWLCVTVHDLQRKVDLRVGHPVVRLR